MYELNANMCTAARDLNTADAQEITALLLFTVNSSDSIIFLQVSMSYDADPHK